MQKLGKGKLLRSGLNALHQAVHPVHGLVWTDGSQVFLTDLRLHDGEVKCGASKVIVRFEYVCGLSWAPQGAAGGPGLLAVQHRKHVTVWQVRPNVPQVSEQLMLSVCEIRDSLPVLPQGCVWHPEFTVLAVLTAQEVSVFPNIEYDSSRERVNFSPWGRVHCACWTQDGQRLVVAVGSSLHAFVWDGSRQTLLRCSPVFQLDSAVRCITATVHTQVAVATELPLEKICSFNASDTLDVPPIGESTSLHTLPVASEVSCVEKGAPASEIGHETSAPPISSDPLDLTHVRFGWSESEGSSLIYLRKNDSLMGPGQDSSHMLLVDFEKRAIVTRRVSIPGILVPDQVAFHPHSQVVAVASNTCRTILIHSFISAATPIIQQIQLDSSERPKGLCFLTEKLLLILVGKQDSSDMAFLPSSESEHYVMHLSIREVTGEASPGTLSEGQSACFPFGALLEKTPIETSAQSLPRDFCRQNGGLLLATNSRDQSQGPRRALIKEFPSPASSAGDGSMGLDTLPRPSWAWTTLPQPSGDPEHTSTPEAANLHLRTNLEQEKGKRQVWEELATLSQRLMEVQRGLSELTELMQGGKTRPTVYPPSQNPPFVHILHQQPCGAGPVGRRAMLLCGGKLRLSALQQAFGLVAVEMLHDSHWVLLTADSEGFIPLTFTASQEVVVRDGSLPGSRGVKDSKHADPAGTSKALVSQSSAPTELL
ncbi:WD repeat and coiled-coil-containing protein isoform X1 [Ochotona curzoniae]|uniref:WD repeat and coiled-coil-containing protein isoform X1 n=1 Tax=Ochotona curzoniae TaxID=130825 RepID=UPI001B3481AE|nr:WD repeat and coiled-coil-containing protein isoform X1 [Ochotona curzoniae]XP_040848846.1 WD repeat and coiled-coil-containing protein isoform X1 [Ochotona curzoniae]